ncbi:MAG: isoprenylcysteine carboxylmethyltransferase family protein [Desulfobacteraceae bacterium]|nr:isoprenylcysteine carboxylmethyltransferase family protein [Desulfobacteraceae bacterium]
MVQWLAKIDQWVLFHPARWPRRELISRCAALSIVAAFLFGKVIQFDDFPQRFDIARRFYSAVRSSAGGPLYGPVAIKWLWGLKLSVWLLEALIYVGYIAAYLSRSRAVAVAEGFMETAFPLFVAGLPVVMAMSPYNLPQWLPFASQSHLAFYSLVMALILIGGLINLFGLLTLRRAFTIMTEARTLITGGLFRYVRHPLYTGHFIMFLGALLLRLHSYTLAMYGLFAAGQVLRAKIEERKLSAAFPQYQEYRQKTGMFFPKWNSS